MSRPASEVAVRATGLSKRFDVYARPRDLLFELVTRRTRHREHWALRDVSFALHFGEVVGLVGQNGAGKSTLLKVLSGIITPTAGDVELCGTVSSILELGTGFHPEYSGRQNIVLAGLCLGMSRREIDEKTDWILDFSELHHVIEQPLKTYSSGMQARLAFSTAMCREPDILIVDEALGIGDVRFQRKCFRKFEELRAQGRAILFVSHNTATIDAICDRAVYLREGQVRWAGEPKQATGLYLKDLFGKEPSAPGTGSSPADPDPAAARYGSQEATIEDFAIEDAAGRRVERLQTGAPYTVRCRVQCHRERIEGLHVGISIHTVQGVQLFGVNSLGAGVRMPTLEANEGLEVRVGLTMWLAPGTYFASFGAWGQYEDAHFDRRVDALQFTVEGDRALSLSLVNLCPRYEVSRLSATGAPQGSPGGPPPQPAGRGPR